MAEAPAWFSSWPRRGALGGIRSLTPCPSQLIEDKKILSEKCEAVVAELKQGDQRCRERVAQMQEQHELVRFPGTRHRGLRMRVRIASTVSCVPVPFCVTALASWNQAGLELPEIPSLCLPSVQVKAHSTIPSLFLSFSPS